MTKFYLTGIIEYFGNISLVKLCNKSFQLLFMKKVGGKCAIIQCAVAANLIFYPRLGENKGIKLGICRTEYEEPRDNGRPWEKYFSSPKEDQIKP